MRPFPKERGHTDIVGWFVACLVLGAVVFAAFVFFGDISSPPRARLVMLQTADVDSNRLGADPCPSASDRSPCLPERIDAQLLVTRRY